MGLDGNDYGVRKEPFEAELKFRFGAFAKRARLLVPKSTVDAAEILKQERFSADIVIVDARFDEDGFKNDVETWIPFIRSGGRMIARKGFLFVMQQFSSIGGRT